MNTNVLRNLSYGLYVVSSLDGDRLTGCTANSVIQINSSPNTVMASINRDNFTNKCIKETGKFAVSILSEKSDPSIIGNFGFQSGKDVNKFENVKYELKEGLPVVLDSCGYIVAKVIDKMETSTHTIFLGEIIDCDVLENENPMTYAYYHKEVKGKSSTVINKESTEGHKLNKYMCTVCGYIYEGEYLPDDFICPICKQGADKFKQIE